MAYISTIHDTDYTLDPGTGDQARQVSLNGKSLHIDWRQVAPLAADAQGHIAQGGRYTLLIEGRSYDVFARRLAQAGEEENVTYEIQLADQRFEVRVEDERARALLGSLKGSHEAGEIKVRAPMPGLVLNVLKNAGESVERGETVVVLEAMKMENDLTTPHGGSVKEVLVSKGQTVNQGDVLLVISGDK